MRVENVRSVLCQNQTLINNKPQRIYQSFKTNNDQDNFIKVNNSPVISFKNREKYLHVISFNGLRNPLPSIKPALQMKVTGVTHFQENLIPAEQILKLKEKFSIDKLALSNWEDGEPLLFGITSETVGSKIRLFSRKFGEIGRVPDAIAARLVPLIKMGKPKNFSFELSNLIAGTTKGAPTTGLRVNLTYNGQDPKLVEKVNKAFHDILNDPIASQKAMIYQPVTSPTEVLKQILAYEEASNGKAAAAYMKKVIDNIASEIDSPENKRVLLIGHCKPDGDTIGCGLGLKNSIELLYPDKVVDCAIDDLIPGLFRETLPGFNEIKQPYSQSRINALEKELARVGHDKDKEGYVKELQQHLQRAKNPNCQLKPEDNYDLVILMDVATPSRFSSAFKKQIENAKRVIFIDHHPLKREDWDKTMSSTGVNMSRIIEDKLAWIAERVPAATQMVAVLASKLSPKTNPLNIANIVRTANSVPNQKIDAAVASFATGMYTDTGDFSRTANLLPEDIKDAAGNLVPVQERPNFMPEGFTKWLFGLTGHRVNKRWLREVINYDINNQKIQNLPYTAREKMLEVAAHNKFERDDIGFGYTTASYDELQNVSKLAKINDPDTNFLDVQNGFKYSEIMGDLRGEDPMSWTAEGAGPFAKDKIAIFACQAEKAGDINTEGEKAALDNLRFSFRSLDGTNHAELLATLFGGGGHGGAAGGNIKGESLTLSTPFAVKINGKKISNINEIYENLKKAFEINHDSTLSVEERKQLCPKFEMVKDSDGNPPLTIIEKIVEKIRAEQSTL